MGLLAVLDIFNYLLALLAAVLSVGILRQVAGGLAVSWRYVLIAFQVLSLAQLFEALARLNVPSIGGLDTQILVLGSHFIFILLAIAGLWFQHELLKGLVRRRDE